MKTEPWYQFLKPEEQADLSDYEAGIREHRDQAGLCARRRKQLIDKASQRMKRAVK